MRFRRAFLRAMITKCTNGTKEIQDSSIWYRSHQKNQNPKPLPVNCLFINVPMHDCAVQTLRFIRRMYSLHKLFRSIRVLEDHSVLFLIIFILDWLSVSLVEKKKSKSHSFLLIFHSSSLPFYCIISLLFLQ